MFKQVSKVSTPLVTVLNISVIVVLLILLVNLLTFSSNPSDSNQGQELIYLTIGLVLLSSYVVFYFTRNHWLNKRHDALKSYAAQQGYTDGMAGTPILSDTMDQIGQREERFQYEYVNSDMTYGEYSYAVYRKARNGEYKALTCYYAVCIVKLPRELPHLFFDAKATSGREFKRTFNRSQRHSLEGNFDSYFSTYFPTYYKVDSLSFITPEVMQSMIDAHAYDIEISGDKMYLYAPLKSMPEQIADMFNHTDAIRNKLLNNILTYRDERVNYADGRKKVSLIGTRLRKNLTKNYLSAILGVASLIAGIGASIFGHTFVYQLYLFGALVAYANIITIRKEHSVWQNEDMLNDAMEKSLNL